MIILETTKRRKLGERTEEERQQDREQQKMFLERQKREREKARKEVFNDDDVMETDFIEQIDESVIKTGIIVDIEILRGLIGEEVTYKNLCELMNWKYDTGNTKKAQLKALAKVVEFEIVGEKKGQKIKFIKLKKGLDLDYIKEQINQQDLTSLIMKSILEQVYFQTKNGDLSLHDDWFVTNRELSHLVGLTTENFQYIENDIERYSYKKDYDVTVVKDITQINKTYVNRKISNALKKLSQGGCHLITWTPYAYKFKVEYVQKVDNGVGLKKTKILEPTLDTIEWMNKVVIPRVLREFGTSNMSDINGNPKLKREFWERVPQWIKENCLRYSYKNPQLKDLLSCKQVAMCHRIGFDDELIEETYNDKEWQLTTEERELLDNLFLALEVEEQLTKGEVKLQIVSTLEKTLVERHEHEKDLQDKGEFREKYWFRAEEEYILTGKLIIKDCHNYSDYKTQHYKKDDEDFDFMAIKEE